MVLVADGLPPLAAAELRWWVPPTTATAGGEAGFCSTSSSGTNPPLTEKHVPKPLEADPLLEVRWLLFTNLKQGVVM